MSKTVRHNGRNIHTVTITFEGSADDARQIMETASAACVDGERSTLISTSVEKVSGDKRRNMLDVLDAEDLHQRRIASGEIEDPTVTAARTAEASVEAVVTPVAA